MEELKRIRISAPAIPVHGNDIDTDRIIPARFLRCVTFDGLGEHAFEDDRLQLKERGRVHPFDEERFADAQILLVNKNFGCGSSREHAPQSIMRWGNGIKAIVGESFAEIFLGNCTTMGIPAVTVSEEAAQELMSAAEKDPKAEFVLDLENKTISVAGASYPVALSEGARKAFLEGTWDSTAALMAAGSDIDKTSGALPYFNNWE